MYIYNIASAAGASEEIWGILGEFRRKTHVFATQSRESELHSLSKKTPPLSTYFFSNNSPPPTRTLQGKPPVYAKKLDLGGNSTPYMRSPLLGVDILLIKDKFTPTSRARECLHCSTSHRKSIKYCASKRAPQARAKKNWATSVIFPLTASWMKYLFHNNRIRLSAGIAKNNVIFLWNMYFRTKTWSAGAWHWKRIHAERIIIL